MRKEHPQWNVADVSEGLPNGEEETRANAALYAEAHNVANETGMWSLDMVDMLAECYRESGADPDGNENWRIAPDALAAVRELRKDYAEAIDEASALRERIKELEEQRQSALERLTMACGSDMYAQCPPMIREWLYAARAILNKNK